MMHYGFGDGIRSAGTPFRSLPIKNTARKIIRKQKRRKMKLSISKVEGDGGL